MAIRVETKNGSSLGTSPAKVLIYEDDKLVCEITANIKTGTLYYWVELVKEDVGEKIDA
jgi:hypothetical protein